MNTDPFLRGYRVLKMPIIDQDGNPTWPDMFPPDAIESLRHSVGVRHFSAQMMLEYIAEEKSRLSPDALQFYNHEIDMRTAKLGDIKISGLGAYWDPSSARISADSSVCALVLRDDVTRRAFIHDIEYLHTSDEDNHPMATQCNAVLNFMLRYNLRHIAIEVNGLGNAMPEILRDTAIRRSQSVVVQKITNHEKKERRILNSIEPLLSTGRLFAHARIQNSELINEMIDWSGAGGAVHDDGLDAVAGALRIKPIPFRARGEIIRPHHARCDFKI